MTAPVHAPAKKKATTAPCPKCGAKDAPIHVAPDGVARIGEHGQCEGQGLGIDV